MQPTFSSSRLKPLRLHWLQCLRAERVKRHPVLVQRSVCLPTDAWIFLIFQHRLLTAMDSHVHLGINSPDPRDLVIDSKQNYRTLPSHYFLWKPDSAEPIIHLVVLYRRGDYYWHGAAVNSVSARPPLNASLLTVGRHAGSIER